MSDYPVSVKVFSPQSVQPTKAGDLNLEVLALRGREFKMFINGGISRDRCGEESEADTPLVLTGTEAQTAAA